MLKPFKELLFPIRCFGCNAIGLEICSKCCKFWNPHLYIQHINGLTIYSSIQYSPIARSVLLSAKENSLKIADELILSALVDCLNRLPSHVMRNAILMPIPGTKRGIRKRGRDFVQELTLELSKRSGIQLVTGMQIQRSLLDQSGLSAKDRQRNINGAFQYDSINNINNLSNKEILLVDDLVTTGATLLEAKRALKSRGIEVNQAITACIAQSLNIGG